MPGRWGFDLTIVALIFIAYTLTMWVAMDLSFGSALIGAMANTVPVAVFGAVVRNLIIQRLAGRPASIQIAGHVILCLTFTLLSLWLLLALSDQVHRTST